jgi:hypothetical protein
MRPSALSLLAEFGKDLVVVLADALQAGPVPMAGSDAYAQLEKQLNENYKNAFRDTRVQFRLLRLILWDASYERMRRSFGMVLKYIIASTIVTGIGIALFAWSTHPPKTDTRQPSALILPAASVTTPQRYLGANCDPSTLKVEALGSTNLVVLSATSLDAAKPCELSPNPIGAH